MKDEKFERKKNKEIELLMSILEMNIFPSIDSYDIVTMEIDGV